MAATSITLRSARNGYAGIILSAGLLLGIVDGCCAIATSAIFFNQPSAIRTFQGVAAALLGRTALTMGVPAALLGVAMHFAVALVWVTVYVALRHRSATLRRITQSRIGVLKTGAILGGCIWLIMNFVVFPLTRLHHLPLASLGFGINLAEHILIVGPLIVAATRQPARHTAQHSGII